MTISNLPKTIAASGTGVELVRRSCLEGKELANGQPRCTFIKATAQNRHWLESRVKGPGVRVPGSIKTRFLERDKDGEN